jgi:hypothetical protein
MPALHDARRVSPPTSSAPCVAPLSSLLLLVLLTAFPGVLGAAGGLSCPKASGGYTVCRGRMADEPGSTGRLTRSQARKRPSSAGSSGKTPLKSPLLSDFWQPRKQARTARTESLRQIRRRGGAAADQRPPLSGHLGCLPEEVRRRQLASHPTQIALPSPGCPLFPAPTHLMGAVRGLLGRLAAAASRRLPTTWQACAPEPPPLPSPPAAAPAPNHPSLPAPPPSYRSCCNKCWATAGRASWEPWRPPAATLLRAASPTA